MYNYVSYTEYMTPDDSIRELAKKTAKSIVDHGSIPMATLKESIKLQNKVDELLAKEIEFPEVTPFPEIPETDLTPVIDKLEELITESKKKDLLEYDLQIDEKTRKKLKGDKGDSYILTAKDKKEIASSIEVPIYEQQVITKEVKQVAIMEAPEEIVKKLESLKGTDRLSVKAIKGLDQAVLDKINSQPRPGGYFNMGGGTSSGSSTFTGLTDAPSSYTGQGTKFVRVNAGETALEFATVAGGGDALTSAPLSQFAATTSLQLKNTISDETGSGALVFANSPALITPTGIVKGDVGLGNVVNLDTSTTSNITDSLNKRFVTDANLTTIGNQSGTNTGDNATNTQYSGLAASKENAITGTTAVDFWSGAKTFVNFATTVRATVLTGLSLVSTTVISATDTVLVALGSLQAQITALTTTVGTKVASVTAGTNVTVTGTATAPIVNAPTMTATVGGAVPTPPNNTTTFLRGDGTFAAPAGSGDMVLASVQTNSGAKTFLATTLLLRNVANTFSSMFTNTATAARTWTLKDADGTIAFTSDITGTNSGTNTGDQTITLTGGVTGSGTGSFAATVITNANLTGAVTSVGNAASLGSFTTAQLNTALSDNDVATGGGTATGSNTGDNAVNTLYSGLVSNATHTGDATGATALTVVRINGVALSGLATGILKNTTGTGVPSIAANSDLPVMSATVGGAVPTPPNNTTTFLRGDGTFAAPTASATITTQDEGSNLSTTVTTLNFTGAGVTASGAGATTTINIPGGAGSFAVTSAEVDFGTVPVKSKRITVTDAAITTASKIMVTPNGATATGRVGNDWEWDTIDFSAVAGTGSFLLTGTSSGRIKGKRKIFYTYS